MGRASIVVPYRPTGDPHRERCWEWIEARSLRLWPDFDVVVGDDGADVFSHAGAFNDGVARAEGDVLVLMDADTTVDTETMVAAFAAFDAGARWVMADRYTQLTEQVTMALLDQPVDAPALGPRRADEIVWCGRSWAGFLVIGKADYEEIGGYDKRIPAWGADDGIMGVTLTTLLGAGHRVDGTVWHLWHDNSYERDHGMTREQQELVWAHERIVDEADLHMLMVGKP